MRRHERLSRVRTWVAEWKDTVAIVAALAALAVSLHTALSQRTVDHVLVRVIEFTFGEAQGRSFPAARVAFVNQGTGNAVIANVHSGLVGGSHTSENWEWPMRAFEHFVLKPNEVRVLTFDPPTMPTEKFLQVRHVAGEPSVTFCLRVHSVDSGGRDAEIMFPLGTFYIGDEGYSRAVIGPDIRYQLFSRQFVKPCDVAPAYWTRHESYAVQHFR